MSEERTIRDSKDVNYSAPLYNWMNGYLLRKEDKYDGMKGALSERLENVKHSIAELHTSNSIFARMADYMKEPVLVSIQGKTINKLRVVSARCEAIKDRLEELPQCYSFENGFYLESFIRDFRSATRMPIFSAGYLRISPKKLRNMIYTDNLLDIQERTLHMSDD